MTYTVTRRLEFDAGHRVYGHESKCAHIHGHRYVVLITCSPIADLDDLGRVVDFSVIKRVVGSWIDENFDHGMLLFKNDPLVQFWKSGGLIDENEAMVHKHYVMEKNPTAENIAEFIYWTAMAMLRSYNVRVEQVEVQETPNCKAVYGND